MDVEKLARTNKKKELLISDCFELKGSYNILLTKITVPFAKSKIINFQSQDDRVRPVKIVIE